MDSYSCDCPAAYTGNECQNCANGFQDNDNNGSCLTACSVTTCSANSTCYDAAGAATCLCDEGYQDDDNNGSCEPECGEQLPVYNPVIDQCTGCMSHTDCAANENLRACAPLDFGPFGGSENPGEGGSQGAAPDVPGPEPVYPGLCVTCTQASHCTDLYGAAISGTYYSCQSFTNTCVSVMPNCPNNASGAPNCECNSGYSGSLTWNGSSWSGTCYYSGGGGGGGGDEEEIEDFEEYR